MSRDYTANQIVESVALLDDVNANPSLLEIARATKQLDELRAMLGRVSLKVACIGSFMMEPLKASLELQALRAGFSFDTYFGGYGQFEQELIDPNSGLARFEPDVIILAVRLQDVCPTLYEAFASLSAEQSKAILGEWDARLTAAITTFRERSPAHLLIQNYDRPAVPALGPADHSAPLSQTAIIAEANGKLHALAERFANIHVIDYDGLVAGHGRLRWQNPKTAFFGRIPIAAEHYWHLAGFYIRHLRPLYGLSKKVIALDADNTLWGGVVGDIGLDGIAIGHDYPGNAFVAFQKQILDLYHRGIVLCIVSKNEPGSVEEVLEKHPHMVLRKEHFAATRINWDPKPQNLQQIAQDLNLGIDSFVFVDDNHVECELMRAALPSVQTIHLPTEPALYPGIIQTLDCFDQWSISAEDRKRGQLYKAQVQRKTLQAATVDMPTFYRQLEMEATIYVDRAAHVARASQMTNRTNQFNMHTLRCSEDDIRGFMAAPDSSVFTLELKDRFGDNGIVGLAVVHHESSTWLLHMFLMSCRVLGRTVEQAFVGWIAARAQAMGAEQVIAEFVPTAKNKPFADFYQNRGFVESEPQNDVLRWVWHLDTADTAVPDWLKIAVVERESA